MDRIDIHVEVPAVPYKDLIHGSQAEKSSAIRERVIDARKRQSRRFSRAKIYANAQMSNRQINRYCALDKASELLLEQVIGTLGLSARAYHRILKVARTIADLDNKANITRDHISEAVQYRSLDRKMI